MTYSTLCEHQFRVLQLSQPSNSGHTVCKLLTLSLDTRLQYTALSYTWGDPENWQIVRLNDEDVKVSRNLAEALKRLLHLGQTLIWADQLCINQADVQERSSQVQIMRNIYEKAAEVIVWLGGISERTDTPSIFLKYFAAEELSKTTADKLIDKLIHDKRTAQYLTDLVNCSYWTRAWIVQEVAVGSRVRVLLQGRKIEWSRFEVLPTFLNEVTVRGPSSEAKLILRLAGNIQKAIAHIYTLGYIRQHKALSLPKIIAITTKTEQTDPRDAIYSKLALASEFDRDLVSADYTKECRDVIMELTRNYIKLKKNINIITMVDHVLSKYRNLDLSLPTWVWDCGVQTDTDEHEVMHLWGIFNASSIELLFQAAGDVEMVSDCFQRNKGRDVLVTKGFCWDRVDLTRNQTLEDNELDSMQPFEAISLLCRTLTACHIFDESDGFSAHLIGHKHLVSFCRMLRHYFTHGDLRASHRFNRLLARMGKNSIIVYESLAKLFELQASFTFYRNTLRGWAEASTDPEFQLSWDETPDDEATAQSVIKSILWMTMNRNIATGKLGQPYLVPLAAGQGDLIVVLAGCALPMVIREVEGDEYELIGECYVDGIMHGEAMKLALQRSDLEEIKLI